jgi:exonuclease SbcD
MKIIHFSDTHLGYSLYDKINSEGKNIREQDFYDAFEFVIQQILEIKPDLVIHSGDFFHRPSPSNRALSFALEQILKLSNHSIPFVIIAGNHSTPKTNLTTPILKIFENLPHVYPIYQQKYEVLDFGDIKIHGLPHVNDPLQLQSEIEKISADPNKKNILMLHTSIGKAYMEDLYGDTMFPASYFDTLNEFDYIALGHWHNFQRIELLKNAWYSGSIERLSESEIAHKKGFCLLDTNDFIPKFIEIPTRNWFVFEIKNCYEKETQQIWDLLGEFKHNYSIKDAILSIKLKDIKPFQSHDFSNLAIKKLFDEAFEIEVQRSFYQKESFFAKMESQDFNTNIATLFENYIDSKEGLNHPEILKDLARPYFSELNEAKEHK